MLWVDLAQISFRVASHPEALQTMYWSRGQFAPSPTNTYCKKGGAVSPVVIAAFLSVGWATCLCE